MNISFRAQIVAASLAIAFVWNVNEAKAADKPTPKPKGKPTVVSGSSAEPLGSTEFMPTPEQPIGWRGDGTGRYPAATPPTSWDVKADGSHKGFVWAQPLPAVTVSSPIIVGDKIFLTGEVSDLICLDKKTGRVLWIRSCPEFEGLSAEDRAEFPDVAKLAPLSAELAQANDMVVKAVNDPQFRMGNGNSLNAAIKRKREIEKKIQEDQKAIDKKKFDRYWGQGVFGFAGQTPVSDGKHVCVFFTTGVSAGFDLNGKRLWIARGSGGGAEHGNFASPVMADGKFIVWANELRGYDVESGKLEWTAAAKGGNTYGSMFRVKSGSDWVAGFQWGFFVRARDGQLCWDKGLFGDSVSTPIVEGDTIFAHVGYPKNNKGAFKSFKVPESPEGGKLTPGPDFKTDWADDELPVEKDGDKKKNPFDRNYVASPLYVEGLVYQMTQGGGLIVNDAATGEVVYRKVLPLKPRTNYWDWAGASTSPTLAGKYIYLMDNQGGTVIIKPGRQYEQFALNTIVELKEGKDQVQNLATPIFEGARMYYRSPGYMFCIGAK